MKQNAVQCKAFSKRLEESIRKYQNRGQTAVIIEELISLAKDLREAYRRGEELGLTEEELAFYDALETNDSAVEVLGDDTMRTIAKELVESVQRNSAIDWNVKESVRAKMRASIRRILRRYRYPPDKQERAGVTVIQQAELIAGEWAA